MLPECYITVVHCEFMLGIIREIMDKFDEKAYMYQRRTYITFSGQNN